MQSWDGSEMAGDAGEQQEEEEEEIAEECGDGEDLQGGCRSGLTLIVHLEGVGRSGANGVLPFLRSLRMLPGIGDTSF